MIDAARRPASGVSVVVSLCWPSARCARAKAHQASRVAESRDELSSRRPLPPISICRIGRAAPRADAEAVMPAAVMNRDDGENSVSAFAALVTSDGHLDRSGIARRAQSREPARASRRARAVVGAPQRRGHRAFRARARSPARPSSLNVVWLVTHRTVRAPLHARVHVRVDGWKML